MSTHPPLWTAKQVARYLQIGEATLYRWLDRDPTFPPRIRLSPRAVRWDAGAVVAWAQSRSTVHRPAAFGRPAKPIRV